MSQLDDAMRDQLLGRRARLEQAVAATADRPELTRLLGEVDAALSRLDGKAFGLCETCGEAIETDRLIADPLVRFCLDHLPPSERRALEEDLALAARVQQGLLPPAGLREHDWETAFHYAPARVVSGDYCDLVVHDGHVYFMLGDVSGKGVASALLMSQLHAMFRTLVPLGLPLHDVVGRASRLLCESTLPTHYATLVCGRADAGGSVEICNAGHPPPILVRKGGEAEPIGATGLPLGMFCDERFSLVRHTLGPGDLLLLYSDGLIEAENAAGDDFGLDRLVAVMAAHCDGAAPAVSACLGHLRAFTGPAALADDLTLLAIRRLSPR
jgi:phosphoserine phosphatase RsbU/P